MPMMNKQQGPMVGISVMGKYHGTYPAMDKCWMFLHHWLHTEAGVLSPPHAGTGWLLLALPAGFAAGAVCAKATSAEHHLCLCL